MSAADPFTLASHTFRAASQQGARHLPLAAGEVAEFKRPASWWLWTAAELACVVGAGFCFLKFIGA